MLDYHGSLVINKNDIINDILITEKYKKYNKEYLKNIINYLYDNKFLINYGNMLECAGIFYKSKILEKLDIYINLDLSNSKKKLALIMQLSNSKDLVYEPYIFQKICDHLKINLLDY